MKRKVIKQGHNTFTVTLPVKWARNNGLLPGKEIEVSEQGNSVIISTERSGQQGNRIEVDISGLPSPLLWRFVSAAYRAGYDEIKIIFGGMSEDKKKLKQFSYDSTDWFYHGKIPKNRGSQLTVIESIQALVDRFIGVEIIEQKPNFVLVKQLGEISYKEFDHALKRIFMISLSTGNDIVAAIENSDTAMLRTVHMIDTNLDRFEDYCLRVLNVKGYEDFKKTPTIYSTIFLLELVGDEYKRIAQHVIRDNHKYNKPFLKFFREVNAQFEAYFDLFYHFSRARTIEIFEREDYFTELSKKLIQKSTSDEKELLHHLKKITRLVISLAELAIDLKADSAFGQNGFVKEESASTE